MYSLTSLFATSLLAGTTALAAPSQLGGTYLHENATHHSLSERDTNNPCFCPSNNAECITVYEDSFRYEDRQTGDGFYVCYNREGQNVVPFDGDLETDIENMLEVLFEGNVCCVDCPTASSYSSLTTCKGTDGIGSASTCGYGSGSGGNPSGIDDEAHNSFIQLLHSLALTGDHTIDPDTPPVLRAIHPSDNYAYIQVDLAFNNHRC